MNVILKNPLLRFAALFVITVLVSALTAYLYHRSLLSFLCGVDPVFCAAALSFIGTLVWECFSKKRIYQRISSCFFIFGTFLDDKRMVDFLLLAVGQRSRLLYRHIACQSKEKTARSIHLADVASYLRYSDRSLAYRCVPVHRSHQWSFQYPAG